MEQRQYYVTVGGEYLVALEVSTAHVLGRNRDLDALHAHVQSLFPGILYVPLDAERVERYVVAHPAQSTFERRPAPHDASSLSPSEAMFCPRCGARNTADAHYCTRCGESLRASSAKRKRNEWVPHALAATAVLLLLIALSLPFKAYSVSGFTLGPSDNGFRLESGYQILPKGDYKYYGIALLLLPLARLLRAMLGKPPGRLGRGLTNYGTMGLLAILLLYIMYSTYHLYSRGTNAPLLNVDETPGLGLLLAVGATFLLVIAGFIEMSRYRSASPASTIPSAGATSVVNPIVEAAPVPSRAPEAESVAQVSDAHEERNLASETNSSRIDFAAIGAMAEARERDKPKAPLAPHVSML